MSLEQKMYPQEDKPTHQLQALDFIPLPGWGLARFAFRNRNFTVPSETVVDYFTNISILLSYNLVLTVAPLYVLREYFI